MEASTERLRRLEEEIRELSIQFTGFVSEISQTLKELQWGLASSREQSRQAILQTPETMVRKRNFEGRGVDSVMWKRPACGYDSPRVSLTRQAMDRETMGRQLGPDHQDMAQAGAMQAGATPPLTRITHEMHVMLPQATNYQPGPSRVAHGPGPTMSPIIIGRSSMNDPFGQFAQLSDGTAEGIDSSSTNSKPRDPSKAIFTGPHFDHAAEIGVVANPTTLTRPRLTARLQARAGAPIAQQSIDVRPVAAQLNLEPAVCPPVPSELGSDRYERNWQQFPYEDYRVDRADTCEGLWQVWKLGTATKPSIEWMQATYSKSLKWLRFPGDNDWVRKRTSIIEEIEHHLAEGVPLEVILARGRAYQKDKGIKGLWSLSTVLHNAHSRQQFPF